MLTRGSKEVVVCFTHANKDYQGVAGGDKTEGGGQQFQLLGMSLPAAPHYLLTTPFMLLSELSRKRFTVPGIRRENQLSLLKL